MDAIFTEFFTRSEAKVGAVCAASRFLASTIVQEADVRNRSNIIELGPGNGVITKEILDALSTESSLACFELSKSLAKKLERQIQNHENFSRTAILEASALDLDMYVPKKTCDCVISSLPWGLFQKEMQRQILEKIHAALTDDGIFLTYAYWGIEKLPKGRNLNKQLLEMFTLESRIVVWKNFPPAVIYSAKT